MKNLLTFLFVAFLLIATMTLSHAQSFNAFVAKANEVTGIYTNGYEDNLKKTALLLRPKNTLYELFTEGYSFPTVAPVIKVELTKLPVADVVADTVVDTTANTIKAVTDTIVVKASKNITTPNPQPANQVGDTLIASKGYKEVTNKRTNKKMSIETFDTLYEKGKVERIRNRQWRYVWDETLSKRE